MYEMGYNNVGQAKQHPTNSSEMAYAIIANACKRFLEGSIKEHDTYTFYSGYQIKIFISQRQYETLKEMLRREGEGDGCGLIVNGKVLGDWFITYFHGKWSCQLILTLSKEFEKKHSIIKRFAQLAVIPLDPKTELYTCQCGFPMVKPVNGEWVCYDCWKKQHKDDLLVY